MKETQVTKWSDLQNSNQLELVFEREVFAIAQVLESRSITSPQRSIISVVAATTRSWCWLRA